jgi:hypothetical protein
MKRSKFEIIAIVVIGTILTLDALVIASNQKLTWTALAQAYDDPAPIPGIAQQGGYAIIDTPEENILTLTSFGPDGKSNETIRIEIDGLAELPNYPDAPLEVASTNDGYVVLYKLPSGEYQATIGPDNEGKNFVYIFEINPLECISRHQFMAGDPTPQFEGPC